MLPQSDVLRPHVVDPASHESRSEPDRPGLQEGAVDQELPPRVEQESAAVASSRGRWRWIEPLALILLSLAINLAGNARTGLWDRDEPRYAVAVREMRGRGDWLSPTFNGEPRYHKPILIYWLMGLTTALAGDNPFGVRLASAAAGTAAMLGVWWLGRRLFGARGGTLATLIYATAPIVVAESKLATTDATLALWLLGCQCSLWILGRRASRVAAACFWVCLNLAILTKGPIGPAFIAAATVLAWWWGWPIPPRARFHLRWGLVSLLVLTCPWFVAVSIISHGEFLRFALGDQILRRVASDMETHGGFPGYYPIVSALVFYPWSALMPAAIVGAWGRRRSDPALGYLLGWTIGPLILLECFRTKLIHYYLPAFPSCALLVAWLILSLKAEGVNIRRWPMGRLSMAMLVGLGLALAAILVAGAAFLANQLSLPLAIMAVIAVVATLAGMARLQAAAGERAVFAMAGCWAAILLLAAGWVVPMGEASRTSRIVGRKLGELSHRMGIEPVLLEYQEPGVIYALGHPVALTRDRDSFFAHLEGGRSVATVLLDFEIEVMRNHFGLDVALHDQVDGFHLTKGKHRTLFLAVVKEGGSRTAGERPTAETARGGAREQTFVK
jgi:4-amino-4-deoxy-L-arabinose transferase-like glycosyltransferase